MASHNKRMMKMKLKTELHILDEPERKKLATFLKEELGIEKIMYMYGNGTDIRLLSYKEDDADG